MVPIIELGKRFKKQQKRANYIDFIDDPVEGLVPVGDTGLYRTPDEPADPTDCDRYPSSPFCGGNPFTETPIGLKPQIIIGDCDIGVRVTPVLGFVKLPPVNLVYRKPECRKKEVEVVIEEPPEIADDNYSVPLNFNVPPCSKGIIGWYCSSATAYFEEVNINYSEQFRFPKRKTSYFEQTIEILEVSFPYKVRYLHNENNRLAYLHIKVSVSSITRLNQATSDEGIYRDVPVRIGGGIFDNSYVADLWIEDPARGDRIDTLDFTPNLVKMFSGLVIYPFSNSDTSSIDTVRNFRQSIYSNENIIAGANYPAYRTITAGFKPIFACEHSQPPPPPKEICCMPQCCPPPNNDLLKLLIKKVNKLSEIVGVEEYPATLPASLISEDEGFIGNLIPNPDVEIKNLTQLIGWFVERFDEVAGQFEIPIEIKDSDPTTPGDQPKGLKIPNIAEGIAEILGLLLQTTINSETLVSLATRTLIETGQDKQQNFKGYMLLQALIDYIGFDYEDKKELLPMTFTPGKKNLDEMLKETDIEVAVAQYNEKLNLQADFARYRRAAGILESRYFRKIDTTGDTKAQVMKYLKDAYDLAKKVNKNDNDDFEKFVEDAEIGFTNTSGVSDAQHPYGNNYSERPKIKDISSNSSDS